MNCPQLEHLYIIKYLCDYKSFLLVFLFCTPTRVLLSLCTLSWSFCTSLENKHPEVMNTLTLASLSLETWYMLTRFLLKLIENANY